jgi:hypothetical protein
MKDTFEIDVPSNLSQGTLDLILAFIWSLDMWAIYPITGLSSAIN